MTRSLPPFGREFEPVPSSGVRVTCGPNAWEFAQNHPHPIMVLPDGEDPKQYRWPSDGKPALIHERGTYDDEQLESLATCLLRAGASSVVAIREALLDDYDPRVFFDKEVINVAA